MHEMFKGSSLYEHMELGPSKGLEYAIDQKFGEERALKMILAWARNLEGRVEGENHEAARKTILELPLVVGGGTTVRCARISIEIPIAHELVARWMAPPMFTSPTSPSQKGTLRRKLCWQAHAAPTAGLEDCRWPSAPCVEQ
jgi:hypothetical protein